MPRIPLRELPQAAASGPRPQHQHWRPLAVHCATVSYLARANSGDGDGKGNNQPSPHHVGGFLVVYPLVI